MNKYIIPFAFTTLICLCSCSQGIEIQKTVIASGYDFTEYTEKGFLFTPEQYLESYESIGLLNVEILPDVVKIDYGEEYDDDNWIRLRGKVSIWKMKKINPQEVLDAFYETAIEMGADAVIRLRFENIVHNNGAVSFYGLQASGFAIKRK